MGKLAKIYTIMGPLDYGSYTPADDGTEASVRVGGDRDGEDGKSDNSDEEKTFMQEYFEARKSGAMYKGELNGETRRPHGVGIKIFNKTSLYEGYFKDGTCHGAGRGITSNGECYQGMFDEDEMTGSGMFYWPDGPSSRASLPVAVRSAKGAFSGQMDKST